MEVPNTSYLFSKPLGEENYAYLQLSGLRFGGIKIVKSSYTDYYYSL